ncbi:hypothetical protein BDZ94DRAFT_1312678 [Collybia nuda]|uniref:DUF6534 domain-containing protein n=1 Tax=Collybia nuda TaxID=64659 RepID=A0A9P5XWP3_9AGAR|nr:hypothetical protein BDZ94DRAFT_1312678 [Collybia nuda]
MTRLDGVPDDIAVLCVASYLDSRRKLILEDTQSRTIACLAMGCMGFLASRFVSPPYLHIEEYLTILTVIYTHRFPRDPFWMKAFVWVIFFTETLITIFGTIAGWKILASGWGDPSVLIPLDWAFASLGLLSGLVASSAHFFYCWRIYKLRRLMIIPVFLVTVSLVTCGMAAFCGIYGRQLGFARLSQLRPWVWLGGSALVDASITICMTAIARSRSYFTETSSLIQRLITITIETAMTTGLAALAQVVLFVVFPHNNMHFIMFLILAKLYSNTLLTALNARAFIGPRDVVTVPVLWEDESATSSQRTLNQTQTFSARPNRDSVSTTIRNSHSNHIELEAITLALNDPDTSLGKFRSVPYS